MMKKGAEVHRPGTVAGKPLSRRDFLKLSGAGIAGLSALGATGCGLASGGSEGTRLRLTHQWPGLNEEGEGDFRAVLANRFAEQVNERTDGEVTIEISPNNSLVEDPAEQYQQIVQQSTDMSVYPLDYAAGSVPQLSATLMPTLVQNHAQAQNWKDADIGQRIDEITQENGIKILTWVWNAGGIGVREGDPVVSPEDVEPGAVARAAGPRIEGMLENAGYSITSMSSSEIYNAMQTGVLDVAVTSSSSFGSYRIYEQVASYTSPTENTFWFMFEPLIIGMEQFEQLTSEQQDIFEEVANELQEFAYTASEEDDVRVEEEFEQAGVNVARMDDAAFEAWKEASQPTWNAFAEEVDGGQELLDLAQQVPTG